MKSISGPDVLTFVEPIDAVYTWVDDTDTEWCRKRDTLLALNPNSHSRAHPTAVSRARFESRSELRYSLRSLEMYAPWIRNIYVVTDNQHPSWLTDEHPGLTIVDHKEILPVETLPTYNSHVIESALHRIPGLSEHFIYFNDDVFLGAPARPEDFFTPTGVMRVFPSPKRLEGNLPVMQAARRNAQLLEGLTDRTVTHRYRHTPHAQRVSVSSRLEALVQHEVDATRQHRFRHPDDISFASSLALSYACVTGEAVPDTIGYSYIDLSSRWALPRLVRMGLRNGPMTICLNQVGEVSRTTERAVRMAMGRKWPTPSRFEGGVDGRARPTGEGFHW